MYFMIFLTIFTSSVFGMGQVAFLQNYVLQDTDGASVNFPGNYIRILIPGLAQRFRMGMREGQTGTIIIHDLDQPGLNVLKHLLTSVYPLQEEYQKHIQEVETKASGAIEAIVYPDPEKQREINERSKVRENAEAQKNQIFLEFTHKAKAELEKTPNIGDYFLNIYNNLILWKVVPILGKAAGIFAAENLDFTEDDQFGELKKLDPQAQLIYLYEAHYRVENVYRTFEWFKELVSTPGVIAQEEYRQFLDLVSDKLVAFANAHIEAIITQYPLFKNLILDPMLTPTAQQLHQKLIQNPQIAFDYPIMRIDKNKDYPQLVALGNDRLGIVYDEALHIFDVQTYTFTHKIPFKVLFPGSKNFKGILVSGGLIPHHIVASMGRRIVVFDLILNKVTYDYTFKQNISIREIYQLDERRLLINTSALRILNLDNLDQDPELVPGLKSVSHAVVFDSERVLLYIEPGRGESYLILWNSLTGEQMKKMELPLQLGYHFKFHKVNNYQCLVYSERKLNSIDINTAEIKKIAELNEPWQFSGVFNQNYGLIKNNAYELEQVFNIYFLQNQQNIPFLNIPSRTRRDYTVKVINHNHIAHALSLALGVIVKFVPQTSTLEEILSEIQIRVARQPDQPKQPAQKRRAPSVTPEAPGIPAAAKGLRPELPETKQRRLEKPNE
ncbi:MAG: hypothetical protein AMXMBFR12_06820 [Candidatus Babeliales bacterium]